MHWKLITPFLTTENQFWIHEDIRPEDGTFQIVPASYEHDRSRINTTGRQWFDYFKQALAGWFGPIKSCQRPVGFITAFPPSAVCVGLIKRLTRSQAPVIAWSFNLGRKYGGTKRRLAAFALASIDIFVVYSRREVTTYASMFQLPEDRFLFVPFTEEMVDPEFEEDQEEPFILSMGTANRDYRTLFDAVGPLGYRTIVIAGPKAIDGLNVPSNVTVRSGLTLAACHELCQKARVNVVPLDTADTASGQVTLRYGMMFRKAVVATTSTGTEDYIEHGTTGILVPPRDADSLAQAIDDLWRHPAKRGSMGSAARTWLLANASYEMGPARLAEIIGRMHS